MTLIRIEGEALNRIKQLNQRHGMRLDVAICYEMGWAYPDTEFTVTGGGSASVPEDIYLIHLLSPIVPAEKEEKWLDAEAVAQKLGISAKALRKQLRAGKYPSARKVGSQWWVNSEDLND